MKYVHRCTCTAIQGVLEGDRERQTDSIHTVNCVITPHNRYHCSCTWEVTITIRNNMD